MAPQPFDTTSRQDIPHLDGLRGAAALLVVIGHSISIGLLPALLPEGISGQGVALFFLLSGFLMGHLYLARPFTPLAFRRFIVSRLARVLPLFYATVLLAVALKAGLHLSYYRIDNLTDLLGNGLLIAGTGVLWSIPVEVHFYLLFALCWFLRTRLPDAVLLCGLLALQTIAVMALFGTIKGAAALPFWLHYFATGAVIAVLFGRARQAQPTLPVRQAVGDLLAWLIAAASIFSLSNAGAFLRFSGLPHFLAPEQYVLMVGVFVAALYGQGPFRIFAAPLMRWLGSISYGVYLLHMPVIHLMKDFAPASTWPEGAGFLGAAGLVLGLAHLSQRYFERPLQAWLVARHGFRPAPNKN